MKPKQLSGSQRWKLKSGGYSKTGENKGTVGLEKPLETRVSKTGNEHCISI